MHIRISVIALALYTLFALAGQAHAYKLTVGTYTGNGSDDRDIVISATSSSADFQPVFVLVKAATGSAPANFRFGTNSGDESYNVGVSSIATNNIQGFNADGFQVGTDIRVNANGVTYYYIALGTDANNDIAQSTYTANGADNRDIVISPSFQPEFVILHNTGTSGKAEVWRSSGMSGDLSCQFLAAACASNLIQQFNADGFQVGSGSAVNGTSNGTTVHYLAIKASSGATAGGTFTGDTNDNRQITTLGFQPEFMIIKGNSATSGAGARFKDHSGDSSSIMTGVSNGSNRIQAFLSNGFEVGTDACCNENTVDMYWYALREQAAAGATRARSQTIFVD